MSVINTNVSSLIAQNSMASNTLAQSKAMQQLSTGLRINGAKDDAAGLAIASKMTSQIKGLDQAVRNSNDAISMLQTADGALVAVGDMMQRMRELAVQASSDTNVTTDRGALNDEFNQLKIEINRISKNTQWNGMAVLDGTGGDKGTFTFQVGANKGQTIDTTVAQMTFGDAGFKATADALVDADKTSASSTNTLALNANSTFKEGDVVSIDATINGKVTQFQYTLTKTVADKAVADEAATAGDGVKGVADAVINAMKDAAGGSLKFAGLDITAPGADGKIVLTANADVGTGFTGAAIHITTGGLGNLSDQDIKHQDTATAAIAGVDASLAVLNSQRSRLGAVINRLTYAADNLANVSQNTSASRSRVQDTDYAKASTELARTQIIAQASTAMLAQANQSQQSVLALLK